MKKGLMLMAVVLAVAVALPAFAAEERKDCETLKGEIAAKLDAKGVKDYTLTIVATEEVKDAKVVGSCDGGSKKIIYERK